MTQALLVCIVSSCGVGTRLNQTSVAAQCQTTSFFPSALRMTIKAIYQYKPWRWQPWSVWFFFSRLPAFSTEDLHQSWSVPVKLSEERRKQWYSRNLQELPINLKNIDNAFVNSHQNRRMKIKKAVLIFFPSAMRELRRHGVPQPSKYGLLCFWLKVLELMWVLSRALNRFKERKRNRKQQNFDRNKPEPETKSNFIVPNRIKKFKWPLTG